MYQSFWQPSIHIPSSSINGSFCFYNSHIYLYSWFPNINVSVSSGSEADGFENSWKLSPMQDVHKRLWMGVNTRQSQNGSHQILLHLLKEFPPQSTARTVQPQKKWQDWQDPWFSFRIDFTHCNPYISFSHSAKRSINLLIFDIFL